MDSVQKSPIVPAVIPIAKQKAPIKTSEKTDKRSKLDSIFFDKKPKDSSIQKLDTLIAELDKKLEEEAEDEESDLKKILTGNNIFYSMVLLLIGYFAIRVVTFILNALAERSTTYRIAFKGSIPIVKIIGWVIILTLIIMVIFQPTAATMLAFSASIGVAVGFASQDILKNIFGGIVILLDRPFVSGDKIEIDKYYGEVVEIGLRSTRIVTPDDSLVAVPNAVMMNSSLSNSNSGEPNCQVVAEIFLPITVDTIAVRKIATQAATVSKYIYLEKPITILFINEVNNNHTYYKMKVKAYVMDIRDEFKFKSEMTELIIKELVHQNILDGSF
ncbi:mechanosensitive ion channel [Marivirga sp. S37H4]|uniref:Mechanosensitive ion channel n=2 Tax=Marivirga aurantiaca TaxID=2802615 RepID=A0A934WWM6_9BACT|nr:mechanosensitive ion channel [Marivirga aurantiaca]